MARTLAAATTEHWVAALVAAKVPVAAVNGVDGMLNDPQVRHLRMAERLDSGEGEYWGIRHPVILSETSVTIRRPPPEPGADTGAVLREYGYEAAEIERLRADRIVGLLAGSAASPGLPLARSDAYPVSRVQVCTLMAITTYGSQVVRPSDHRPRSPQPPVRRHLPPGSR
jgi:hypothetical protein